MKILCALAVCGALAAIPFAARAADEPLWAWGFTTQAPTDPPAPAHLTAASDNNTTLRAAGSKFSFTHAQVVDYFGPADWFPEDHPPMPEIVAHGRKTANPPIYACGMCHLPNGNGRPENASLAGLMEKYIVQQLEDFRNGGRQTSDKRKTNTGLMAAFARNLTDEEIASAASYFAAIPAKRWIKVIESDTVPKTRSVGGLSLVLTGEDAGTEPIGNRIVETPIDEQQTEVLRNPRVGFVAYVPKGSLAKGAALVKTGNGKVTPCTVCHGADLRGLGPVPRLAGLSPSYIARQLYDMQTGSRAGAWTPLMAPVVINLDASDLLAAAAYLSSLSPY